MTKLYETAKTMHSGDLGTKPLFYYQKYDDFLTHHNINPKSILEIGVYNGESTKIIAKALPNSNILALDINLLPIDFTGYPNVVYGSADQTNGDQLKTIIMHYFPDGIDLVIDDASHIGYYSKLTFDAVFPFVKSGGVYFVEDWGTGYWDDYIDGSRFQNHPLLPHSNNIPKRIQSHDFGMVGFVKSLVDLTHEDAVTPVRTHTTPQFSSRVKVLEFGEGICMLQKS